MEFILELVESWKLRLKGEIGEDYFISLNEFLQVEQDDKVICPADENIYNALNRCPFENIKVVILGQDPYHGKGQSHGLAFSVQDGVAFPPSLRNIFQEYCSDLGYDIPSSGNLTKWAEEGVLLLNAVLTVRVGEANSHKNKGWERFTDRLIKMISDEKEHIVFVLWGKQAQSKGKIIDETKHLILSAPHPSPLSSYRGFFGSKPFSKANSYLKKHGITQINWKLK